MTTSLTTRLSRYSTLTMGMLPLGGVSGAIIGNPSLSLVINSGQIARVDFGPGFGEVFAFEVRHSHATITSSLGIVSTEIDRTEAAIGFNPSNAGGVTGAFQLGGAPGTWNPRRLGSGASVGDDASTATVTVQTQTVTVPGDGLPNDLFEKGRNIRLVYAAPPTTTSTSAGSWVDDDRGFLGFRIDLPGAVHYGWFDIESSVDAGMVTIHGWALNTTAGEAILAGQLPGPGAGVLATLAMGAAGLRRHRRQVA